MLTKICSKCNKEKQLSEFYPNPRCKLGVEGQCKQCRKEVADVRKEEKKLKDREYSSRPEIKEKRKQYSKRYYEQNKEKLKQQAREHYNSNAEQYHEYDRQRSKTEERIVYRRNYNETYYKNNREKLNAYDRQRYTKRRENIKYVLGQAMAGGIRRCIGNNKADRHWEYLVGYTFEDLTKHLESQFTPEMNWDNFGSYWEIDHIIPQNIFSISSAEDKQFKICWSLANLRPLEKSLNRQRPKDGRDVPKEQAISILGLNLYYDIMDVENDSLVLQN